MLAAHLYLNINIHNGRYTCSQLNIPSCPSILFICLHLFSNSIYITELGIYTCNACFIGFIYIQECSKFLGLHQLFQYAIYCNTLVAIPHVLFNRVYSNTAKRNCSRILFTVYHNYILQFNYLLLLKY